MKSWGTGVFTTFITVVVTCVLIVLVFSQMPTGPMNDEQRRLIEVRRRQVELRAAQAQLKRTQDLVEKGLMSRAELDRAMTAVETAQINYQESVLSLLALQPRLSIREAVKYQTRDGRKFVRLTVENLTPTFDDSQIRLLSDFEGTASIPEEIRRRELQDIFISLKASGAPSISNEPVTRGTTIALPYEAHIQELKYGQAKTVNFQLLRDVISVLVVSSYKGQNQEIDIQLQQAGAENVVAVTSTQISQEADLSSQATFSLRLERSTVDVRRFQLKVVNLPHQISYSFLDPGSQARLSEINFPAGVTQQNLDLRLFLPERADEQVQIDRPLEFWALVMDEQQAQRFQKERIYSLSEIEQSRVGRARLAIIPRGVGRIEVSAVNLFSEIQAGETIETSVTIRNTGTRRLDNIKLTAEYPLNWQVDIQPDIVSALEINREEIVKLRIIPSSDASVGDYELRIKTDSYAYNRRVPSENKIYRVSVKEQASLWGTAGLLGGLLLLIIGVVVFGIKLTRK